MWQSTIHRLPFPFLGGSRWSDVSFWVVALCGLLLINPHHNTFQIIVSSFLPNETHLKLDSEFLTKDTDSHAILGGGNETIFQRPEEKQDITQKGESYLRGKWVTIAALNDKSSFELAEIRVYGSKERIPLKNIWEKCGLLPNILLIRRSKSIFEGGFCAV